MTDIASINKILTLCRYARERKTWVVGLTSTSSAADTLRGLAMGSCSEKDIIGGRTLVFHQGGKLSIIPLFDDLDKHFSASGADQIPYEVCFLERLDPNNIVTPTEEKKTAVWYAGAQNIVNLQG